MAEEKEDGNVIRFIRGYDLVASDSESARTYYHYACDEQGSITHILGEDETGEYSLKNYYEYGALGDFKVKEEEVENRFGYNGEIFDPIGGQYYLRVRYYNPVIGRFTQEDTYYGDGLNLYAYCRNLPIGYSDPSGHYPCQEKQDLYKKYREQGMTAQEANRRANYDLIKRKQGKEAADKYLQNKYKHNPSDNPKVLQDAVEDSSAVYGYSPNPNSESIGEYANSVEKGIDWSNPEKVAEYRRRREVYHKKNDNIDELVIKMKKEGFSLEEVARATNMQRNQNRLNDYIGNNDMAGLARAKKRNLEKYGHEFGLDADDAYKMYGSWEKVIEKSKSANPGMDA